MRRVVGAYVAGAAAFALLAVLALFVGYPGHDLLAGENASRAQGLFKDPNVFGPFLIPAALILLEESLRPRLFRLRRAVNVALLAVLVLGIVFAYSRAAWLNLVVAVCVMLAVMALRADAGRSAAGALALIATVAAVGGAAVVLTGSAGFLQERAQIQSYDTQRFSAQRTGVELAEDHALGIGPGQFETASPVSAHSIYIRVLAEQGPLGLAVLVMLLGATLALAGAQRGLRARRPRGRRRGAAGCLVRTACEQRVRRHVALAAPVVRRRPDLGGRDARPGLTGQLARRIR